MNAGTIIGHYRLVSKLGEGGMGEVWLAEDTRIDRKVAIKILHAHYARNQGLRVRFRNEALTLSKLQHPNIVTFYDLIETDELVCLVMEYVQGRNLEDIVRKDLGPMPAEQLSGVFKQILLAFDHAHRAGVVHRDIKPSNFMLTDAGVIKVLDFGIAKLLDDDQHLTLTGTRMGTTYYMSPEQVNGNKIDHRSDIYSLGVTLFVLATGRNPYEGETVEFKVYSRIVQEPLPKARSIYPAIPASVELMIDKATAKDPARRFQNCGEFLVGAGIGSYTPSQQPAAPQRDGLALRDFKGLRALAALSTVGGVIFCWVPLLGSTMEMGSLPLLGVLASLGITFASIGILRSKSWSKWLMRSLLMIYGLACAGSLVFPSNTSSTYSSQTWTGFDGVTHHTESYSSGGWPFVIAASLAIAYVIWGLVVLFSKKNQAYLDQMQ